MTVGALIQQLKAADEDAEIVISDISSDGIVLDINGEPFRITIPVI